MILKKEQRRFLKNNKDILNAIFKERLEELKNILYLTEPEDGKEIRGRAREIALWLNAIKKSDESKSSKIDDGI